MVVSFIGGRNQTTRCGLQTYYKENDNITKLDRRVTVLPLIPQDVWFNALQDIGDAENVTDTTTFTDYITKHWVETQISLEPLVDKGARPTNHIEGCHNKIKRKYNMPIPKSTRSSTYSRPHKP